MKNLPDDDSIRRRKPLTYLLWYVFCMTLITGVFFLGLFLVKNSSFYKYFAKTPEKKSEVFGFAPYWTLSKINNIDWTLLTTFAYFSLPVNPNGTIDKTSYEWTVFESSKLKDLFKQAEENKVRRVLTLTQMEPATVEGFLNNPQAWDSLAADSVEVLKTNQLDGVNIDFEYIPSSEKLKSQFSQFIKSYTDKLKAELNDPYITVSVLASSVRYNKIYDVGYLTQVTDGVFMMAYDFYYPGSEKSGPTAPLYGYNNGKGPFWYDVSTAVDDFLKVADSKKVIMGIPFYGWDYQSYEPVPKSDKIPGTRAQPTTLEKAQGNQLIAASPIGGWDDNAKVSWRGYWDDSGWHVVYLEDERSLAHKYDFAKKKNLAGIGIWALGYEHGSELWSMVRNQIYN